MSPFKKQGKPDKEVVQIQQAACYEEYEGYSGHKTQ